MQAMNDLVCLHCREQPITTLHWAPFGSITNVCGTYLFYSTSLVSGPGWSIITVADLIGFNPSLPLPLSCNPSDVGFLPQINLQPLVLVLYTSSPGRYEIQSCIMSWKCLWACRNSWCSETAVRYELTLNSSRESASWGTEKHPWLLCDSNAQALIACELVSFVIQKCQKSLSQCGLYSAHSHL